MSTFRRRQRFKPGDTPAQTAAKLNRAMLDIERSKEKAGATTVIAGSGSSSADAGGTSGPALVVQTVDGLQSASNVYALQVDQDDGFQVSNPDAGQARIKLEQPVKKDSTPEYAGEKLTAPLEHVASAAPAAPDADHVKVYVKASGVSPKREVAYCIKDEAGREIILSSVLV